jgi:F420H(2)-dependent quinone reductase
MTMPLQGEWAPGAREWANDQVRTIERSGGTEGLTALGVSVVVITSRGARSGKLRKNPVMRVEHEGAYAAVASKGGGPKNPTWFYNLLAHPEVEVQDATHRGDYVARLVTGEERAQWWTRALSVFSSYADYQRKTDREIPVFVLERAARNDRSLG